MRFTSFLAASASLFAVVYANAPLAFTAWPSDIQAGKPVTLTWEGGAPDQVSFSKVNSKIPYISNPDAFI